MWVEKMKKGMFTKTKPYEFIMNKDCEQWRIWGGETRLFHQHWLLVLIFNVIIFVGAETMFARQEGLRPIFLSLPRIFFLSAQAVFAVKKTGQTASVSSMQVKLLLLSHHFFGFLSHGGNIQDIVQDSVDIRPNLRGTNMSAAPHTCWQLSKCRQMFKLPGCSHDRGDQ